MLPNFVHVGVNKAGTTWLWQVCREHPDIYVPETKPVNFFLADYHRGIDWYESTHFKAWNGEKAVGDQSNGYVLNERALERIARHLGRAKIMMTVRPPIERSFVHCVGAQAGSGRRYTGRRRRHRRPPRRRRRRHQTRHTGQDPRDQLVRYARDSRPHRAR